MNEWRWNLKTLIKKFHNNRIISNLPEGYNSLSFLRVYYLKSKNKKLKNIIVIDYGNQKTERYFNFQFIKGDIFVIW